MRKKGFTLIELLVIISIIGLLSSIAFYAINSARIKARDARRKADLVSIAKALELYYDDYNHYPVSNYCGAGRDTAYILPPETNLKGVWAYNAAHSSDRVISTLKTRGYIGSYLSDPLDPNLILHYYRYYTDVYGQNFVLMTFLENPTTDDLATLTLEPPLVADCSYGNYRVAR
ncbi:MAG: prepilin-type N-terminal cleavage/methylation domain-containing protein [Patescibacteria group bacterium]